MKEERTTVVGVEVLDGMGDGLRNQIIGCDVTVTVSANDLEW
jgi:hypothetical protein